MDVERTMQFIVEQQAQLTASQQKHDEQIRKHDEQLDKISRLIAENAQQIAQNSEQIRKHGELFTQNSEQIHKHDQQIASLTDLVGLLAQAETRLNQRLESTERRWEERVLKMDSSQQEMREAFTKLLDRLDRFIQGRDGNGHHPA